MLKKAFLDRWNQIPGAVKSFLLKALIILVVWKVLYLGFLAPSRLLDGPLTATVGKLSVVALNVCTGSHDYTSERGMRYFQNGSETGRVFMENLIYNGQVIGSVEDACNALELFVLYISFIWILPSTLKRKIWYTIIGIISIFAINVARCAGITYLIIFYPQYSDFAHHYIFAFVVYAFIIALWLAYSNKVTFTNAEDKP
jgi:exosortase/archaeosortase family protein